MFAVVLALFVPTKEEALSRRTSIRHRRDITKTTGNISTNDGLEENSKFTTTNKIKENEIRDQIADSTEKKEIKTPTSKNHNKTKTGTVVTNIKNIVTHEDVDGHRSALSEALLHQFHGPNEKVLFLPDDEDDILKHEHTQLIDAGQQLVLNPEPLYQYPLEEKVQKLLLPQVVPQHHHHHQPLDSKVIVLRKSQEDVLTNLHHYPQRVVYYPRGDEHLINLHHEEVGHHHTPKIEHVHPHGDKPYLLLPKITDETVAAINQLHYHPPTTPEDKSKMQYLPTVFANPEVAHKSYGGGYTLPVAPGVLSTLNVEHTGKVPVVVSNMAGFNAIGSNSLVNHLHKLLQLQLSKSVLPHLVKHVKLAEQQVDKRHEIDLGSAIHHHFTIVKKVGVPYIKPVAYPVVQRVPIIIDRSRLVKPYHPSVLPQTVHAYQIPVNLPVATPSHLHHHHHHQSLLSHHVPVGYPYVRAAPEFPIKIPLSLSSLSSLYKRSPSTLLSPTTYVANLQKTAAHASPRSILIQKSEPVLVKHELGQKI